MSAPEQPPGRGARVVLLAGWGLLLSLLAAAGAYVALAPPAQPRLAAAEPATYTLPEPSTVSPAVPAAGRLQTAGNAAATAEPLAPPERPGEAAASPAGAGAPAWKRFARPAEPAGERPRIAVVITGLGLAHDVTQGAIDALPPAVTLSFSPYAEDGADWLARAREAGHEVMLDLPMEPRRFPQDDPGPRALMVELGRQENLQRLDWILSRGASYVGVAAAMGSRFAAERGSLEPVLRALHRRGLVYLDNGAAGEVASDLAARIGLPYAVNDRTLDADQVSPRAVDARLVEVERTAESRGRAVTVGGPYPVTVERLATWADEASRRGFALVPLTAIAASNLGGAQAAAR